MSNEFTNSKLIVISATEIQLVAGETYSFELSETEYGCAFVESISLTSTIMFDHKKCEFFDTHNSIAYTFDTCDYSKLFIVDPERKFKGGDVLAKRVHFLDLRIEKITEFNFGPVR